MNTVYFDIAASERVRLDRLYQGQLLIFSPCSSSVAFRDFCREIIETGLGKIAPQKAHYHLAEKDYLAQESAYRSAITNHPETPHLIRAILAEFSCDLQQTYFAPPYLRMAPYRGYLSSGEGLLHDPHRDTWYASPQCQINWWIPLYDLQSENALAFHPNYWNKGVKNGSTNFNDDGNFDGKLNSFDLLPTPQEDIEIEPEIRPICPPGGIIMFSSAQMHSAVPNTSEDVRYSIDFRTVNLADIVNQKGAPNIDSDTKNTCFKDFLRATDLQELETVNK